MVEVVGRFGAEVDYVFEDLEGGGAEPIDVVNEGRVRGEVRVGVDCCDSETDQRNARFNQRNRITSILLQIVNHTDPHQKEVL